MFDFDEVDPSEKIRLITISNGVTYKAEQKDPYGLWDLSTDKGALPNSLQGNFTTFEHAKKAVQFYLNDLQEKIVKIARPGEGLFEGATEKDVYNPPVLQTKRPRVKKVEDVITLG